MKRIVLVLLISIVAAISAFSQNGRDATELTLLLNEFLAGAGRNDAEIHDRFWAEDLIYTRSSGIRTNKPDLMKGVRSAPTAKPADPVTVYTAEDIRIQQYGNTAVVAFKLVGTTTKSDGTKSVSNHLNTGTFVKRKGKWQAVAWQATTIPPPPVAAPTAQSEPVAVPLKTAEEKPSADSPTRTYVKGPRGGCYYVNPSGAKVYVDKKYCP
jgi:hypothetical protein